MPLIFGARDYWHIVEDAALWKWSSYRATVGKVRTPDFLTVDQVLSCMSLDRKNAREFFKYFVHADIGKNGEGMIDLIQSENNKTRLEMFLRPILDMKQSVASAQRKQRILSRPSLEELFSRVDIYNQEQHISRSDPNDPPTTPIRLPAMTAPGL